MLLINGWGKSFIYRLAEDLQKAFPGIVGFSRVNIFRMKSFFSTYVKSRTAVRQIESLPIFGIPLGHNIVLIAKISVNKPEVACPNNFLLMNYSPMVQYYLYVRIGKN